MDTDGRPGGRGQNARFEVIHKSNKTFSKHIVLNKKCLTMGFMITDLPPKLEDTINKALEKDRNLRYQSAAEMRADLQRLKRDTDSTRTGDPHSTSQLRKRQTAWTSVFVPSQTDRSASFPIISFTAISCE